MCTKIDHQAFGAVIPSHLLQIWVILPCEEMIRDQAEGQFWAPFNHWILHNLYTFRLDCIADPQEEDLPSLNSINAILLRRVGLEETSCRFDTEFESRSGSEGGRCEVSASCNPNCSPVLLEFSDNVPALLKLLGSDMMKQGQV